MTSISPQTRRLVAPLLLGLALLAAWAALAAFASPVLLPGPVQVLARPEAVEAAMAHTRDVVRRIRALFPGKPEPMCKL